MSQGPDINELAADRAIAFADLQEAMKKHTQSANSLRLAEQSMATAQDELQKAETEYRELNKVLEEELKSAIADHYS